MMIFTRSAAFAAALTVIASSAMAAGSETHQPPKPTKTSQDCTSAQIWDEKKKDCVDPKSGHLTDDDRYNAARELAYDGQFENALTVLAAADDPNDPRILNYKGFANRKAGRMEVGMEYYRAALAINPDYILARSYMGQALIQQNDMVGAWQQLDEIRARGGQGTWAYTALKQALAGQATNY